MTNHGPTIDVSRETSLTVKTYHVNKSIEHSRDFQTTETTIKKPFGVYTVGFAENFGLKLSGLEIVIYP